MTKYLQWNDYKMWLLVVVSRICLDNTFVEEPWLGNQGERFGLSWVLLLMSVPLVQTMWKNIAQYKAKILIYTELIFYTIGFIPFTSLVCRGWFPDELTWRMFLYWIVLWVAGCISARIEPKCIKELIRRRTEKKICLASLVTILFLVVLYINWNYAGGRLLWGLSWEDVYKYRLEARTWQFPAILQALFNWAQIMCTLMAAWFVFRKKFIMACLFILLQWFAFSVACDKGPILITCMVVPFIIVCSYIKCSSIPYWLFGCEIMIWTAKLLVPALNIYKYDLLNRRLMFNPQMLHMVYYDFFTKHDYNYFRSGFLRYFGFDGPYPMGIPRTIGTFYFNPDRACNNGLFSDAYSNLGDLGILIMPFVLVLFLRFCDMVAEGLEWQLKFVAAAVLAMAFISGAFISIVILQGSLVLLLLLFFPRIERCLRG